MPHPFFPDPMFAWVFSLALVALTAAGAVADLRALVIPKTVSLTTLGLGLAANVVRAAWLGAAGLELWALETGGAALGALDGLLFALAGFAVGFGLFLVLWLLGTAGGGDVKLFAAVGAWLGPKWILYALVVTYVIVFLGTLARAALRVATGGPAVKGRGRRGAELTPEDLRKRREMGYGLPVALATAAVVLWVFRAELGLRPAGPVSQSSAAVAGRAS
jgi:prepilin peptidase CpaA